MRTVAVAAIAACALLADAARGFAVPGSELAQVPDSAAGEPPSRARAEPEFPREWFWGNDQQRRAHDAMIGQRPPALTISRWIGAPQKLADLRGKVVIVDFWGTWCGPCMRALPVNKRMLEEHGEKGLVIVGIHDHRRGVDRLDQVILEHAISYPVGVDDAGRSAQAWNLAYWPTYGVIDREGTVRAVGLQPDRVADVVAKLIAEPLPPDLRDRDADAADTAVPPGDARSGQGSVAPLPEQLLTSAHAAALERLPETWIERLPDLRADLERLIDRPAPALPKGRWMNSRPLRLEDLRGKVVLLDFWATWCVPCIQAIPQLNALQQRHRDRGLVVIGVCHARGAERMADMVARHSIAYPVVIDTELVASKAYKVDSYPDYYLIDRRGTLRGVDLRTEHLELALERLLAE